MADPLQVTAAGAEQGGSEKVNIEEGKAQSDPTAAEAEEQERRDREREEAEAGEIGEDDWGEYGPEHDLEDQFAGMRLHGEEEEELDFSEEVDELIKDVRWLGLFRVHTTRPFGHAALLNQMRNAWAAAKGVTFSIKGPNLFTVQCHCLGDWKRIMEGGPWLFRRQPVVIQEYDGFSDVLEYKLNKIPVWARIKGLPDGLTSKRALAEKVAGKVGGPSFTVVVNEGTINPSSTLRARVYLDVETPLVRFVLITLKERKRYRVYYEKLPDFCYFCGLMGHTVEECGDGIHDPRTCEWGDWLLWTPEPPPNRPFAARGGAGGARGRSGGRGNRGRRQGGEGGGGRNQGGGGEGADDMDLMHAAPAGQGEKNVRKRLVSADGTVNVRGQAVPNLAGKVAGTVLLLEGGTATTSSEVGQSTPGKVSIVKRRRQGVDEEEQEDDPMILAASREEDRPSQ